MKLLIIAIPFLLLTGCVYAPSHMGPALVANTTEPLAVTSDVGNKQGKSCATNILGIVSSGDMSVEAAKKEGKITKVASVDYTTKNILFVYAKKCTIVTGS